MNIIQVKCCDCHKYLEYYKDKENKRYFYFSLSVCKNSLIS